MTGVWTVFTSWRASGPVSAAETSQTFTDWPSARRQARDLVCCRHDLLPDAAETRGLPAGQHLVIPHFGDGYELELTVRTTAPA